MSVTVDEPEAKFADYAHPERLVSTSWLADNLHRVGTPALALVESDEDVLLYSTGHIPGAVTLDWHLDLNDPVVRDYIDGEQFAALLAARGITRETTVVIYGDKSNWWAAYALWVFTLFGHPDVRLLDGGRDLWIAQGREITTATPSPTPASYPVIERDDARHRVFREDVLRVLAAAALPDGPQSGDEERPHLLDTRSAQEYTGERLHMPDYPEEGALRGGHIPTARSAHWALAVSPDGTFLPRAELEAVYGTGGVGFAPHESVITYCRIGERSSHTWFVLRYLLGFETVRNYDGSWTEWGNAVRVPITQGAEPGTEPGYLP